MDILQEALKELPELVKLVSEGKNDGVSRVVMTLDAFPKSPEHFHAVVKWLTEEGFSVTIISSRLAEGNHGRKG